MIKSKGNFYTGLFCLIVGLLPPYTGIWGFMSICCITLGLFNIGLSFYED